MTMQGANLIATLGFLACIYLIGAKTVHYELNIEWQERAPDGFSRPTLTINGQFPGPTLTARQGDRLVVKVRNHAKNATTIHWHGIFQIDSIEMDGVPFVTQCPILPGEEMVYKFNIGSQLGTYWYHSHFPAQSIDGLKGALIIYPKEKPTFKYQHEYVVQLTDWYHQLADDLFAEFLTPASGGNEPVPFTPLINGIGQGDCTYLPECQFTAFTVPRHSTTRLRIINTGSFANIFFSIDDHIMEVIEVDGTEVVPYPVNYIRVNVAQRYSVLVHSRKHSGSYWMRASFDQTVFASPAPFPNALATWFEGHSRELPHTTEKLNTSSAVVMSGKGTCCPSQPNCAVDFPTALSPLDFAIAPRPDRLEILEIDFFPDPATNVTLAHVNGISFEAPTHVSLLDLLVSKQYPGDEGNINTLTTHVGEVVDILVNNNDTGEHPVHFHGHVFYVLGMGPEGAGPFNPYEDFLQTKNPVVRDTASVNAKSWLYLRYKANNPGLWLFHCHINWHSASGFDVVVKEGAKQVVHRLGERKYARYCPVPRHHYY